jgi:hypothetical protein
MQAKEKHTKLSVMNNTKLKLIAFGLLIILLAVLRYTANPLHH